MKTLVIALIGLLTLSCSLTDVGRHINPQLASKKTTTETSIPHCLDLYMQAQVSPKAVSGSWNCLAKGVQDDLVAQGFTANDTFFAKDTGYTENYSYVAREKTGGYVFEVVANGTNKKLVGTIILYLDQSGKVAAARSTSALQIT